MSSLCAFFWAFSGFCSACSKWEEGISPNAFSCRLSPPLNSCFHCYYSQKPLQGLQTFRNNIQIATAIANLSPPHSLPYRVLDFLKLLRYAHCSPCHRVFAHAFTLHGECFYVSFRSKFKNYFLREAFFQTPSSLWWMPLPKGGLFFQCLHLGSHYAINHRSLFPKTLGQWDWDWCAHHCIHRNPHNAQRRKMYKTGLWHKSEWFWFSTYSLHISN